ncbi:MAG: hypothetical protein HDT32_04905 [Clostridiales bacterium]|nr:hypothetical protein [Clostridiales bacterium]
MNKQRRQVIDKLIEQVEELKCGIQEVLDEEDEYRENIPESMTVKQEIADSACENLDNAISSLDEVEEYLQSARDGE